MFKKLKLKTWPAHVDHALALAVRWCLLITAGVLALRVAWTGDVDWFSAAIIPAIKMAQGLRPRP